MRHLKVLQQLTSLLVILLLNVCIVPNSVLGTAGLKPLKLPLKPAEVVILPGFSHNQIEVKFLDDIDAVLGSSGYPIDRSQKTLKSTTARNTLEAIARDGGKWCRMPGAPEEAIDRMRVTAEINLGKKIADLNNYFILTVPSGVKAEQWIDQLNTLPEVEIAQPLPLPVTQPFPPSYQYL